jgi:hypothetical protein
MDGAMKGSRGKAWGAAAALGLLVLAGCASGGDGSSFGERIILAGPTVPPEMTADEADVHCPAVEVMSGGSVIQSGGGEGPPRSVISLGQLARECKGRRDGSTVVNVGVEGRAILSGNGPSRFDVPVRIVVKSRGNVVASRVIRASIAVPAGGSRGSFAVVGEGLVVPAADASDFEIEVGLGGTADARRRG